MPSARRASRADRARRGPTARVEALPCALFVALAEEGWTQGEVAEAVAHRYLDPVFGADPPDVLVLGCTHFPLLVEPIRAAVTAMQLGHARDALALHEAERWRTELIDSDDALTRWTAAHPEADTQALRAQSLPPGDDRRAGAGARGDRRRRGELRIGEVGDRQRAGGGGVRPAAATSCNQDEPGGKGESQCGSDGHSGGSGVSAIE
jgi:hypothetical protein